MLPSWSPISWKEKPIRQSVAYPDQQALAATLHALSQLPPLVTSWEVENLKRELAEAARGERFLLQGGDCCESFASCRSDLIANKLKILLKMGVVLTYGSHRRVIRVGRFAGQYAKPRSADTETRDGVTLPSFRGNLINCREFTPEARTAHPVFLLRGYERAAMTLNFIRGLIDGGFADMRHPELWDLDFVNHAVESRGYREMMRALGESVTFMETMIGRRIGEFDRVEFFTSHEGLHLDYEQAQTRQVPRRTGWYDLTTHFPWIGDRTRDPGGAHVEFFRGIANPVGVKVGPSCTPEELVDLCGILNPENEPGRLTVIHRFGAGRLEDRLPPLLDAVLRAGAEVLWCCDPMHGNTISTASGVKTRDFDEILGELTQAFAVHQRMGTRLGGVHFELTGENVTECIGGARGLTEADLSRAYESDVDPRLNYEQALEMALLIARQMSLRNGQGAG
ncbi:MAG: 3-deoxy-7-phosphoheptulonate synthase class II [Planctomycetaceae bacterium]|nr:3-deoxy-7-phosphoheptulonate synthase class II [Planctomycetaceae bacterium]